MTARERAENWYDKTITVDALEREIQAAIDEALERAAQAVERDCGRKRPFEEIASEIRALKSQPQPLPPTVKHDPAIRDSMRAIPEQPPYLPSMANAPADYRDFVKDGVGHCGRSHEAL